MITIGSKVKTKSSSGLWLADVSEDGSYNQLRKNTCVLDGDDVGEVLDVNSFVVDYDEWERLAGEEPTFLGKHNRKCYLIKCKNGIGWGDDVKEVI